MNSKKPRRHLPKPRWQQKIGEERISRLFQLAEAEFPKNPERSHKYISLARKIAMRYNIRLPPEVKRLFCRKCYKYLKPSINCRVRASAKQKSMTITCLECGHIMRHPYRQERLSRKKSRGLKPKS